MIPESNERHSFSPLCNVVILIRVLSDASHVTRALPYRPPPLLSLTKKKHCCDEVEESRAIERQSKQNSFERESVRVGQKKAPLGEGSSLINGWVKK